jgi:hypothetical protein
LKESERCKTANFLNASERIFIAEDKPEVVASALDVDRSSGKWLILDRSSSRLMFDIRDMTRWCRCRGVEGRGGGMAAAHIHRLRDMRKYYHDRGEVQIEPETELEPT